MNMPQKPSAEAGKPDNLLARASAKISLMLVAEKMRALITTYRHKTFTKLRKGGALNDRIVEAVVFQNGRVWSNDKTHLFAEFKQTER